MTEIFVYAQHTQIPGVSAHSIFVVKVAHAMRQIGYQSYLLLPASSNKQKVSDYYRLPSSALRIHRLSGSFFSPFTKRVNNQHLRTIETFQFALKSWWWCRKNNIQIIETADIELVATINWLWRYYQPKLLYDAHIPLPNWVRPSMIKRVILAVATTDQVRKRLISRKLPDKKVIIMPMGYDPEIYKNINGAPDRQSDKHVIGFVGRFQSLGIEKGIFLLLKVAALIKEKLPVSVIIVGGPEEMIPKYHHYANSQGLTSEDFEIHSAVSAHEVPNILANFDIAWMVYPRHPHFELNMSPMKAIEYMASNRPIIASDFPSVRTILTENEAYLVDPDRLDQIVETLEHMLAQPLEAAEKAERSKKLVKQFTWVNRQKTILSRLESF